MIVDDDESDNKQFAADVAMAELRCSQLEEDLARTKAELKRLSDSSAAMAAKNKALKAELHRLQRADTLKAVVEQNKALVARNKELTTQLGDAHTRIAELEESATVRAHDRDPMWDGLLSERSQNDHLNARLLSAFLRNIDAAVGMPDADEWK